MTLHDLAERHRLKLYRHGDGEPVIPGKYGHLYEHGDGQLFGLMFLPGRSRLWSHARRKLEAVDFIIWQDGDEEGSALFNPEDRVQVSLALKIVGVKRKRQATPAQLANLRLAPATKPSSGVETMISAVVG